MTGEAPLADEIEALMSLRLEGLREVWRNRYGALPKLRSAELLRHCLAWRLQAEARGGLIPTAQNSDSQGIPFLGWM